MSRWNGPDRDHDNWEPRANEHEPRRYAPLTAEEVASCEEDGADPSEVASIVAGVLGTYEEPGDRERQAVIDEACQDQAAINEEYAADLDEEHNGDPWADPRYVPDVSKGLDGETARAMGEWARQNAVDTGPTEEQVISWGEHNAHTDGLDLEADR